MFVTKLTQYYQHPPKMLVTILAIMFVTLSEDVSHNDNHRVNTMLVTPSKNVSHNVSHKVNTILFTPSENISHNIRHNVSHTL